MFEVYYFVIYHFVLMIAMFISGGTHHCYHFSSPLLSPLFLTFHGSPFLPLSSLISPFVFSDLPFSNSLSSPIPLSLLFFFAVLLVCFTGFSQRTCQYSLMPPCQNKKCVCIYFRLFMYVCICVLAVYLYCLNWMVWQECRDKYTS